MRCCNCGHCYLNPVPDPSELPTIYPPNYGNYSNSVDAGVSFRLKGWLEGKFLLAPMDSGLPENAAVLDIGCGDGRLLDGVRNHCPRAADLEGVEISEVAAEAAGKKGYVVHLGSFDEIQFPGNRYDLVFLIQVIEHVFDPVAAVRKIHALLKPGGWVVFETPSVRCVDFALFKRRFWGGYHFPRHINLFEPGSFRKMLASQGFDVASIKHKLQPVHWIWTCHHFFKSRGFPGWWTKSFHIKNVLWLTVFSCVDLLQLLFLRRSSNMQIIAQKRRTATVTEDVANSRADGNRIMPSLETEKDAACSAFVDVC
ncbi:MAG: class I SAM-dependent methyltransferase [Planctomycetaceae bacterium]